MKSIRRTWQHGGFACTPLYMQLTTRCTWICFYIWHTFHHHHLSLNGEGRWGTTDDFTTSFLHFFLFSTALWDLANARPVHSLMLSSLLFLCLPCLLPDFTVLCKIVSARPDEQETWPYYCSLCLFMMVRRSTCGSVACWILVQTSLLVTWSLYELCSILQYHLISMACILLRSSAVRVHDSQAHRKMDMTKERISCILELRKNTPVNPNWFQPCRCCCCLYFPGEYLKLGILIRYN